MIAGYKYEYGAITNSDTKRLNMLLSQHDSVPDYIHRLWRNITNKVQKVEINMFVMNQHDEYKAYNQYGYLKWHDVFFKSNGCIKLTSFIKIFHHNLNQFIILNEDWGFHKSISLDKHFLEELYDFINYINNNYLKQKFESLIIIKPKNNRFNSFIKSNKNNLINKFGWTLDIRSYHDPKRNEKSNDCLFIYPIN